MPYTSDSSSLFQSDRVFEKSDARNFDLNPVTREKIEWGLATVTDTSRRAGHDDVACFQFREARDVHDDFLDRENHLGKVRFLNLFAVYPRNQPSVLSLTNCIRENQVRAETTSRVEILTRCPLMCVALPVAHATVIVA